MNWPILAAAASACSCWISDQRLFVFPIRAPDFKNAVDQQRQTHNGDEQTCVFQKEPASNLRPRRCVGLGWRSVVCHPITPSAIETRFAVAARACRRTRTAAEAAKPVTSSQRTQPPPVADNFAQSRLKTYQNGGRQKGMTGPDSIGLGQYQRSAPMAVSSFGRSDHRARSRPRGPCEWDRPYARD